LEKKQLFIALQI